jgi:hypothetical protein
MSVARLPLLRLARSRPTWVATAGLSALALGAAWIQQHRTSIHGADRALDFYATLALPLVVYALVAAGIGSAGLASSGRPLVRLGAPPARVARATVVVTMLTSAIVCGVLGAFVAGMAHGAEDPPRTLDVLHTFAFGALAGGAYAAYFLLGAALVAGFWGRALFLAVDWIVGSGVGLGAAFMPRSHLRNLLGGEPPFEFLPWESLAALTAIAVVCATLAVRRAALTRT